MVTCSPDFIQVSGAPLASTISSLISSAESGDRSAADALFAALYSELHRMAERQLVRGGGAVTLDTTTLLHEAYLDVVQRQWDKPRIDLHRALRPQASPL